MNNLAALRSELQKIADPKRAKNLQRFFKTGIGEYGEGDVFLGIKVPQSRKLAVKYKDLDFTSIEKLLRSKIHEERLIALLILVYKLNAKASHSHVLKNVRMKKRVFDFYLENIKHINNWDLVDLTAPKIVGEELWRSTCLLNGSSKPSGNTSSKETVKNPFRKQSRPIDILFILARSENMWERRIAVLATFQFIKNNRFNESLKLAGLLLNDKHDLIHKAVGWMLREIGKKDLKTEIEFLNRYYRKMPRTMLRYAIERFPENTRKTYLSGKA